MKNNIFILLLLAFSAFFSACIQDSKFDEPPTDIGTDTPAANATVSQIRDLAGGDGTYEPITQDLTIRAVVISDDRAGNFYKQLIVQDSTGGIEIETYGTFLYAQFPVGREVAIKCKGLTLYTDNGTVKLVGGIYLENGLAYTVGLSEAQVRDHVIKGKLGVPPTPKVITINDASNARYLSTLVRIENLQFSAGDTALQYAVLVPPTNVNRYLQNCGGDEIILRNSAFANFASAPIPNGKGSIVAVLGTYRSDRQLLIRDLKDVKLDSSRCGGGSGGSSCTGGAQGSPVTVTTIDEAFTNATVNQDININGWTNFATNGARKWRGAEFSNDKYAQCTAFGSSDLANEGWLVSPAIDVSSPKTFSFESSWGYYKHQGLSVWYSTNFGSTDICNADWKPLPNVVLAKATDGTGNFSNWIPSGLISLPVIAGGKVYIGFKYVGDKSSNTTTWRIDKVKLN